MDPRSNVSYVVLAIALGLGLGCQPKQEEEEDELPAFVPPPDVCNTCQEALTNASCQLKLGEVRQELIGAAGDQDCYVVQVPAGLNDRSLLHLNAGYQVPLTAVNLSVNILRENFTSSVATGSDVHGQAAPRPVDMILPFKESSTKLFVLVKDAVQGGRPQFDARAPYSLMVELVQNPDANEPNDTTPTPIVLAASGANQSGSQTGYLATADDVDRYSFEAPQGRKVTYLHLTGPKLFPPPAYKLAYKLNDASGAPVSEGWVANEFLPVDLATARITNGGAYTVVVQGYRGPNAGSAPIPGDLRLQYKVEVVVMPEADGYEPNDTMQTARAVPLGAPGASTDITARLGHVPDPDWFSVELAANSKPSVLYYRVTPTTTGGRFAPLPGLTDRMVRVFTPVTTGASEAERQNACRTNASVCPRKDNDDAAIKATVDAYCGLSPPRCMLSTREETVKFTTLRNFEGAIPVPPHTGTAKYYLLVQDDGSNWADDLDYRLRIEWRADPDEESRFSGSTEQTAVRTLAADASGSGFPNPPSGAAYELTGRLTYGHGFTRNLDPADAHGVRGPKDYDVFTSDSDRYELRFPTGLSGPLDRTWELQWEIEHAGGSGPPYDVVLELEFCDGSRSTTGCSVVARSLGYKGGNLGAWHSAGVAGAPFQPVYSRQALGDRTQVTGLAWGCFCFERRFVQAGKFYLTVTGVDRTSYVDAPYRIRTAFTDYPKPYNGGMCPAPVDSGGGTYTKGCEFTK